MSNVYFSSDFHLGHPLVSGLRGFHDAEGKPAPWLHDAALAKNWDAVVKPDDHVWLLGDIVMGDQHLGFNWLFARPGTKHLISGNHDACWPGQRDYWKAMSKFGWKEAFATISPFARRKIIGRDVMLSHFPYGGVPDIVSGKEGDRSARFDPYRLPDMGTPLLHGHVHKQYKTSKSPKETPMYHVGLDAHDMKLVPLSTLEDWARNDYR